MYGFVPEDFTQVTKYLAMARGIAHPENGF
jgi:hypothetical protein